MLVGRGVDENSRVVDDYDVVLGTITVEPRLGTSHRTLRIDVLIVTKGEDMKKGDNLPRPSFPEENLGILALNPRSPKLPEADGPSLVSCTLVGLGLGSDALSRRVMQYELESSQWIFLDIPDARNMSVLLTESLDELESLLLSSDYFRPSKTPRGLL